MTKIRAHEFITLDGVSESPSWTFEFGFDPAMSEDLGALTGASSTILLGRRTHEMYAPAWHERTVEHDPGAPFLNDTEKLVVDSRGPAEEWAQHHPLRSLRRRQDARAQRVPRRRHLPL